MRQHKTLPVPVSGAPHASSGISRRQFIKMAAAAGLLAGCRPAQQTGAPPPTAPLTQPTGYPTTPPTIPPTIEPTSQPTIEPTSQPAQLSKVVRTHHAGVWDGENLVPEALRQMLDASIARLTGLDNPAQAWAALFDPSEQIAIKVNAIQGSRFWTHVPLVTAVTECLQQVGVPAEQIIIFDRLTSELENAGFTMNQRESGVRCYGTDGDYAAGWELVDLPVSLSNILLNCDALINMPILKGLDITGISFAMKNHYGTFDRPWDFHEGERMARGLAGLNALPPIKDRARLIIGDLLTILGTAWESYVTGDSILMSFDPVAHDTVGLRLFSEVETAAGRNPEAATNLANGWLECGAELGIGTNDPDNMELVEINLT